MPIPCRRDPGADPGSTPERRRSVACTHALDGAPPARARRARRGRLRPRRRPGVARRPGHERAAVARWHAGLVRRGGGTDRGAARRVRPGRRCARLVGLRASAGRRHPRGYARLGVGSRGGGRLRGGRGGHGRPRGGHDPLRAVPLGSGAGGRVDPADHRRPDPARQPPSDPSGPAAGGQRRRDRAGIPGGALGDGARRGDGRPRPPRPGRAGARAGRGLADRQAVDAGGARREARCAAPGARVAAPRRRPGRGGGRRELRPPCGWRAGLGERARRPRRAGRGTGGGVRRAGRPRAPALRPAGRHHPSALAHARRPRRRAAWRLGGYRRARRGRSEPGLGTDHRRGAAGPAGRVAADLQRVLPSDPRRRLARRVHLLRVPIGDPDGGGSRAPGAHGHHQPHRVPGLRQPATDRRARPACSGRHDRAPVPRRALLRRRRPRRRPRARLGRA